ncbi:acyltransferase domain-containing protein [Streptomyces sp. NRRL B-3648]|uniref:acyltransferase domain-containing protein n=1 Tax=Streptomyces sp. NRRL B-3648 TaxID=1519493 RepID=UPI0018FE0A75
MEGVLLALPGTAGGGRSHGVRPPLDDRDDQCDLGSPVRARSRPGCVRAPVRPAPPPPSGRGVRPAALLGHSVGEAVAAVVAGVMSLPDAVRLPVTRTEAATRTPPGGMPAVAASPDTPAPLLPEGVVVGAVNGPRQTLPAGADVPLAPPRPPRTTSLARTGTMRIHRSRPPAPTDPPGRHHAR